MSRLSLDMTNVRIPTATYRLQFNKNFTFRQAREIVAYLHYLGISDAYASPYFQAGAESLHGYDITDHNKFNAATGSREDYDASVAELHAHGMGQSGGIPRRRLLCRISEHSDCARISSAADRDQSRANQGARA